jgi:hypothetical protein
MAANDSDAAAIDALVARLYAAFRTRDGAVAPVDTLREVFLPDAVIVKAVGSVPEVFDVSRFIETRRAILSDGALVDFDEWELDARSERHGHVVHRWSLYRKVGTKDGVAFDVYGAKSLQCVSTPDGWRIVSLAWDDARDGLSLPEQWPES